MVSPGEAFLAAWSVPASSGPVEPAEAITALIDERYASARAAWPGVEVTIAAFVAALAKHAPRDRGASAALRTLRTDDLYLATGCALGDPRALVAFQALTPDIELALRRLRLEAADAADLAQSLRVKLFVGTPNGDPKIASYAARGSLKSWVYTAATHHGLNFLDTRRTDAPLTNDVLARIQSTGDPELDYLKTKYRSQFEDAFHTALSALSGDERTLLAHYFVDGLTMEELATLHRTHRATIGRRLASAREAVFAATIAALRDALKVDHGELESIMRLIDSQLDFSIGALLANA